VVEDGLTFAFPLTSGTTRRIVMRTHLIALLLATLLGTAVSAAFNTDANACPRGYARCGGACCPGR
jgi:hypothetical protein